MNEVVIKERTDANISGTVAVINNTELIPTPGPGKRLVVTSFIVQNESQAATTIILHNGAPINGWRVYAASLGNGLSKDFPSNHPWKLAINTPLYIYLSGANSCNYSIQYHEE